MNNIIKSAFAMTFMALALTSCEDVPMPFDIPSPDGGTEQITVEPAGEGTEASPYNVAKALKLIGDGTYTSENVVIKGIVTKMDEGDFSEQFGNITYYLADTKGGAPTLEVYRGYSFGGEKFKALSELAVGDTVTLSGVLTIHNATKEVKQSRLLTVNGKQGGTTTPETPSTVAPAGKGTEAEPYNVAAISEKVAAMAADASSAETYYIKGKVKTIKSISTQYGNAEFTLTDDGNNSFTIFRALDFGKQKFTSETAFKVGDEVVVCGKVVNYKGNTPETVANEAWLVSVNGKTEHEKASEEKPAEGTTGEVAADVTLKAEAMGFAEKKPISAPYTSGDITLTFAQGEGTSAPAYYPGGNGYKGAARMYAKNSLVIKAGKKIAKIIITTSASYTSNGKTTVCHGNKECYIMSGDKKVMINIESDTQISFSGLDSNELTLVNDYTANRGGDQLRIESIAIIYAK